MLKPSLRILVHRWWPVLFWLGVIRLESTDTASASNTSELIYVVLSQVSPHIQRPFVDTLDEVLRKTGHFLGYGILGALVFLALRNTNRDWLRSLLQRPWGIHLRDWWRGEWLWLSILVTLVTASFDEMHQSFLPSRTGRWQDVILDTCGAAILQLIIYALSLKAFKRHATVPEPEFSPTR